MRMLEALIAEIASERGWSLVFECQGWVGIIQTSTAVTRIFGYHFELNPSAAAQICGDKVATYQVLRHFGIEAVPHLLFFKPGFYGTGKEEGIWNALQAAFAAFGGHAVCKPLSGTGGIGVRQVRSQVALEQAAHELFSRDYAFALSPFLEIEAEYRVILLDREPLLIYHKKRPELVGNGHSTLLELAASQIRDTRSKQKNGGTLPLGLEVDPFFIPEKGQKVPISFKHNLGLGAKAEPLDDPELESTLTAIARRTIKALGMRFCSVDIVRTGEQLAVLEVNAGVMMEAYARQSQQTRERAKSIYERVLVEILCKTETANMQ